MLIDSAPEPELFSSAFHGNLIEMPNIAGVGLPSSQVPCYLGAELGDPTTNALIRNVDAAFKQHFLNFTQAQIEPQVQPHGMGNDWSRKSVAFEADIQCLHHWNLNPTILARKLT